MNLAAKRVKHLMMIGRYRSPLFGLSVGLEMIAACSPVPHHVQFVFRWHLPITFHRICCKCDVSAHKVLVSLELRASFDLKAVAGCSKI